MKKTILAGMLCSALLIGGVASADEWRANSPESIEIREGETSYCLKVGDTLWAISQKLGIDVSSLAKLSHIDLTKGEQYNLPIGYEIRWNESKTKVELVSPQGEIVNEVEASSQVAETKINPATEVTGTISQKEILTEPIQAKDIALIEEKDGVTIIHLKNAETSIDDKVSKNEQSNSISPHQKENILKKSSLDDLRNVVFKGQSVVGKKGNQSIPLKELAVVGEFYQSFFFKDGSIYILESQNKGTRVRKVTNGIVEHIKKDSTGHNNDVYYIEGSETAYITPGFTTYYTWNLLTNQVEQKTFTDVKTEAKNKGTRIDIGAVTASSTDKSKLYLAGVDRKKQTSVEMVEGDKLVVYSHDVETERQKLLIEDELGYVTYIQGATELNNKLYVATNSQTTNTDLSNYKGITVKVYDLESNQHVDDIVFEGKFEPEGIQTYEKDGESSIAVGIGSKDFNTIGVFNPEPETPVVESQEVKQEVVEVEQSEEAVSTSAEIEEVVSD